MRPRAGSALPLACLLLAACSSASQTHAPGDGGAHPDAVGHTDAGGSQHDSSTSHHDGGKDVATDTGHDAGPLGPAVLQHHNDGTRAGLYVDPDFTKAAVVGIEPLPGFSFSYPSLGSLVASEAVFAQALYESSAVKGGDALFVATELDNVYALDPDTGALLWRKNVGMPASAELFPSGCGSIYPLGITGTPIIDASSGTLFAVAMDGASGVADYVVHALSVADGSSRWTLDLNAALAPLDPPFDSSVQMQRGALTIAGGVLYIPFGALAGACGSPYAWVVGVPLATPTAAAVKSWHPKTIGAGIWGPSGVATDGTSVYVGTSENTTLTESPDWSNDNSEALLRLGAGPTFTGATTDYYAPPDWFAQNAGGGQIGSSGVVLFDLPGSTPSTLAFVIGKTANASLVNRADMGGIGGQLSFLPSATSDWVEGAMAAYTTASGTYVAVSAPGSRCAAGADLSTIKVQGGAPPALAPGWCANAGGHGSPMVTASSVSATGVATDAVVWTIGTSHQGTSGNGLLTGFDGDTGSVLVQPTTLMADVEHWLSPIVVKGRMYVAGDKRVYAFDLKGAPHPSDAGALPLLGDAAAAAAPQSCLLPVSNAQIDPCVPFGSSCQGNPQTSELGACATPTEGQACLPAVGCATGLRCLATGTPDGGASAHLCYASCNATTPCAVLSETCSTAGDAGVCVSTSCSTYFGACQNGGVSGTCFPSFGNAGEETGSCFRGGTVTTGTCASSGAAPASQLCATGELCATITGSACMPFCNALTSAGLADGGPACSDGLVCVPLFGPTTPAGLCAQPCGTDGGASCPATFTCEEWNGATGAKACFP
jgi:outer membrane protein assembly factor BamB